MNETLGGIPENIYTKGYDILLIFVLGILIFYFDRTKQGLLMVVALILIWVGLRPIFREKTVNEYDND